MHRRAPIPTARLRQSGRNRVGIGGGCRVCDTSGHVTHFDKQFFDVSGASMMTLINIRLEDNGADPFFQRAFLAGLTIGVIPEPTTLTLLALASLVLFRRSNPAGTRRRRPMI